MVDEGSRILAGRYEVGELIGRGGMAEVHIGHDTRLGRTVAIKILRSDLARDPSFQNRFRREAQAAAALNHPAIVAVYDTGEDVMTEPTGVVAHVPFIVMEYVEGHTVRHILRDGHAVPIEEAIEISVGVLSALEYSHHAGIVHRDIKPANVMLTPTGAIKVMDFGIARAVADSAATMTQTQAVIGTAQYLSPEQARGETVDARSDLYSAGCLLFELLTGRPPFTGDSPVSVAYQHVREAAPVPSSLASDVPDALDRITLKALAKERDARYSSAAEFRSDLEAVLRGGTVGAPPVGVLAPVAASGDTTQVLTPAVAATQAFPPVAAASPWAATGATGAGELVETGGDDDGEKKRSWIVWLLVAIAVLAVGGTLALLLNQDNETPIETVAVPPVAGMTEDEAKAALAAADLIFKRAVEQSDTVTEDLVIRSDPAEGTQVDPESVVTVYISTGPDSVAVPDVAGMTEAEAQSALEAAGLKVAANREDEDNPNFEKGEVTKTDPAAGETIPSDTEVTLWVSTGNVELPDLVGKKQDEAVATLNDLNLRPNTREVETIEAEPGTVISQDRQPGLVPQGTAVTLEIAVAPETLVIPSDLVGQTWADVEAQLKELGFTNIRRIEEDSDQELDTVLWTEPGAGTEVEKDQQIDVHVSRGPQQGNDPGDGSTPGNP